MTAMGFFESQIKRISPPWLARRVGGAVMRAIGAAIDTQASRAADGVRARFPGVGPDDALSYVGSDRVIVRGPAEPAGTYADRLQIWWDSHRTRGGPYALLGQLFAFWRSTLNVPIDLVYQTGRRYQMDTSGAIVRDDLTWSTGLYFDGVPEWSRIWLFFYVTELVEPLVDEFGAPIVDEHGDPITVDLLLGDTLPDEWVETFSVVPRQWSAAHVRRTTIVLLKPGGFVWGYPRPMRKWGDGWKWGTPANIRIVLEG